MTFLRYHHPPGETVYSGLTSFPCGRAGTGCTSDRVLSETINPGHGLFIPVMAVNSIYMLLGRGSYEPGSLDCTHCQLKEACCGTLRSEDAVAAAGALTFMTVAGCPLLYKLTALARVLACRSFQQKNNLLSRKVENWELMKIGQQTQQNGRLQESLDTESPGIRPACRQQPGDWTRDLELLLVLHWTLMLPSSSAHQLWSLLYPCSFLSFLKTIGHPIRPNH